MSHFRFFQLMGSVFSFVSSDVKSKIEILQQFRNGSEKENFVTLKQMIQYEVDGNLLKKSNYISGSRTFLRLHRGLGTYDCYAVISLFLSEFRESFISVFCFSLRIRSC